jgi:hypothetical protein
MQANEDFTNFFATLDLYFDETCVPQVLAYTYENSSSVELGDSSVVTKINCSNFNDPKNEMISCNSELLQSEDAVFVCAYYQEILTIDWNTQQICGVNWMSTVWDHANSGFGTVSDTSGIVNWNLKLCAL